MSYNIEEIRHAYKSKYDLTRKNQVILLMITDCKKWHYLVVKRLSVLLQGDRRTGVGGGGEDQGGPGPQNF